VILNAIQRARAAPVARLFAQKALVVPRIRTERICAVFEHGVDDFHAPVAFHASERGRRAHLGNRRGNCDGLSLAHNALRHAISEAQARALERWRAR
jgi:hypothetical protein